MAFGRSLKHILGLIVVRGQLAAALPTCVNTSFRGYNGNWTMATKYHPGPMKDRLNNFTKPALMNGSLTPPARGTTAWAVPPTDTGTLTKIDQIQSIIGRN